MKLEQWTRDNNTFRGLYSGFMVEGFKYFGPQGEIGWHTTSWPNEDPINEYWVRNGIFHHLTGQIPRFGDGINFMIGDLVEDLDPSEKKAVSDAIKAWENQA